MISKLQTLDQFPCFDSFSIKEKVIFANHLSVKMLEEGEIIAQVGDESEGWVFIVSGLIECMVEGQGMVLEPRQSFGALSCLQASRRAVSLKALETCVVLVLSFAQNQKIELNSPTLGQKIKDAVSFTLLPSLSKFKDQLLFQPLS